MNLMKILIIWILSIFFQNSSYCDVHGEDRPDYNQWFKQKSIQRVIEDRDVVVDSNWIG